MDRSRRTMLRYLEEAHATEQALKRDLETQIAMTPAGPYRTDLEHHLRETRDHATRVRERATALGLRSDPIRRGMGIIEAVIGQALSLGRGPLVLLRGHGGEEKLLKNAKDSAAAEALEIATYTAIERLAHIIDDEPTAKLAASIRADEERMLERLREHIGSLTEDFAHAELHGEPSYDPGRTGAAEAVRGTARSARTAAGDAGRAARQQVHRVPGLARAEGEARGLVASADDLPIAGYDALTADEIIDRLAALSQVELGMVDAYERRHADRSSILHRIDELSGAVPWPGYDDQTANEIRSMLTDSDDRTRHAVADYERAHKHRQSVLQAAERAMASSSASSRPAGR